MVKTSPGYAANRARISLALSEFNVPLLSRIYHAFDGDMVAALVLVGAFAPTDVLASRWEARQAIREGAKSVRKEKKEAIRELRKCETRECARREIRREIREDNYDSYYRGDDRRYRDGRYWDRYEYERRYYRRRDRDDDDFLKGAVVGAAVVGVGVAVAIANSNDD